MPYWTRTTVFERLVQLIEDVQLVADAAVVLDTTAGSSVGLPEGAYGPWRFFAIALVGLKPGDPCWKQMIEAVRDSLEVADDLQLGEGRTIVGDLFLVLHQALPDVDDWVTHPTDVGVAAKRLRSRLAPAEDEALRVLTGLGDLRRNLRRAQ